MYSFCLIYLWVLHGDRDLGRDSGIGGQLGMAINMSGYTGEKGRGGGIEYFYYNNMARIAQYSDQNYSCLKLFKLNSTNPVYPTFNNNIFPPLKTTLSLFLPAMFNILVICIHWHKNNFKIYNGFQFRYLFLKSKKKQRKHINLFVFPKLIFLIKVIILYNSKSVDIYSGNDLYPKQSKDFFSIESIKFTDHISSKVTNLNYEMYVLSKLKLKNHSQFFRYLMLLSGDIELNPGPIRQHCSICSKLVNKRSLFCLNCNLATHKKCEQMSIIDASKYLCQVCRLSNSVVNPDIFPFSELDANGLNSPANSVTQHLEEIVETNPWQPFKKRGLHIMHLNINSLLNKIHELRSIAQRSNPTVIGITESKIDKTILDSEVDIDGYSIIRCDRTRNGGGVLMYINNNVSYKERANFSKEIENVFVDILLPKTKPILVGVLYNPFKPDFLDNLSNAISNTGSFDNQEVYLLGDFNINLWHNGKYIFHKNKTLSHREIHKITSENAYDIIKYQEFCSLHGLKQLISTPTRITENRSSLLDHVLTNTTENIPQFGVIEVGLSDHQLTFATRKTVRDKTIGHRQITIRSFKNYSIELYKEALSNISFPNYETFTNMNAAYSDFTEKLMSVINKIAPIKTMRAKSHTEEWFDGEVLENIKLRDKLFKRYKNSRLHIDKEIYNAAKE